MIYKIVIATTPFLCAKSGPRGRASGPKRWVITPELSGAIKIFLLLV